MKWVVEALMKSRLSFWGQQEEQEDKSGHHPPKTGKLSHQLNLSSLFPSPCLDSVVSFFAIKPMTFCIQSSV